MPHPTNGAVPSVLHRGDLIGAIFSAMYRPNSWAALAEAIARAEDGNGTALAELSGAGGAKWDEHRRNITDAQRADNAGWGAGREMGQSEAGMAVSCGDAPPFEVGQGDVELWTGQWLKWRDEVRLRNNIPSYVLVQFLLAGCTEPTRWARVVFEYCAMPALGESPAASS